MGFWDTIKGIAKVAAPVVGGIVGGPAGAAIGAGVSGWLSNRDKAKQQEEAARQAGQTANQGFNWLNQSQVGQNYLPAGGQAINQEAALLGLGGDPAAANAAYQNYLKSVGYQGQLKAGQQAITTSRAASGLLGSGSTAKALTRFGQDLASQSFNNYLANLRGVSGMGLQAGQLVGNAAQAGGSQASSQQFTAGQNAADSRASGWDQLLGGFGSAYDAWQAGKKKKAA